MENDEVQRLLLAAHVRDLAAGLRNSAAPKFSPEDPEAVKRWRSEHPLSEFVPQALASIREVEAIIRSLKPD